MKLSEKVQRAGPVIASILRHDDDPIENIRLAAEALRRRIDAELDAAENRAKERIEKAAAEMTQA